MTKQYPDSRNTPGLASSALKFTRAVVYPSKNKQAGNGPQADKQPQSSQARKVTSKPSIQLHIGLFSIFRLLCF
jgi:hypothetical protein